MEGGSVEGTKQDLSVKKTENPLDERAGYYKDGLYSLSNSRRKTKDSPYSVEFATGRVGGSFYESIARHENDHPGQPLTVEPVA